MADDRYIETFERDGYFVTVLRNAKPRQINWRADIPGRGLKGCGFSEAEAVANLRSEFGRSE